MNFLHVKMEVRVARFTKRRSTNATVHLASLELTVKESVSKVNIERNEST